MSNSLNLSNNEIGYFNDIYMLKNTGQSSIYDIFGTKTELSSLGGLNTTTLSQITSAITGLSTISSTLATKATITTVGNLETEIYSTQAAITPIINNTIPTIFTRLSALDATVSFNYFDSLNWADSRANAVFQYAFTIETSVSNLTTTVNSTITSVSNLNNTVGSLITSSTLSSNLSNYATTVSLNNLNTTVSSNITSISNLNNTVGSLITSATLSSNLSN